MVKYFYSDRDRFLFPLYLFFGKRTTVFSAKKQKNLKGGGEGMRAFGVVAEYDPFHSGHAYHLSETRRLLGENVPAVCVMSGSWTQRGSCALTDKWTRTALALRGGADLVLELPVVWATASAEGFAQGAVSLLKATGVVDAISFGSESGQLDDLRRVAKCLEGEAYQAALREELNSGISFAEARQRAALRIIGKRAEHLRGANDNLAVEYLRAAGEELPAVAVPRKGVTHDSDSPSESLASASLIRTLARQGDWAGVVQWTPAGTAEALQQAGIADIKYAERAFLARLRTMRPEDFAALPDSGAAAGLPERLAKAAEQAGSLEQFYALAKTRCYTHARIRRLALHAYLNLTAQTIPPCPAYLRVLGFNTRGQELLKEMKEKAALPVLTKPAHIKELGTEPQRQFQQECKATGLYALCFLHPAPCNLDYTTNPVIL